MQSSNNFIETVTSSVRSLLELVWAWIVANTSIVFVFLVGAAVTAHHHGFVKLAGL